jgi:peptide/nickel transport system ATP-binding protein
MEDLQRRMGMAIIIITHDLGVVAETADRIAVMYAGRVVEYAATERIFAAPEHPYTWGLLKSIPKLAAAREEQLVPIFGRPPSLINRPSGCHFHPRCPYVRDAHRRIDPKLEPLADAPDHGVACLLTSTLRRRIWDGLKSGRTPDELRELVDQDQAGVGTR